MEGHVILATFQKELFDEATVKYAFTSFSSTVSACVQHSLSPSTPLLGRSQLRHLQAIFDSRQHLHACDELSDSRIPFFAFPWWGDSTTSTNFFLTITIASTTTTFHIVHTLQMGLSTTVTAANVGIQILIVNFYVDESTGNLHATTIRP